MKHPARTVPALAVMTVLSLSQHAFANPTTPPNAEQTGNLELRYEKQRLSADVRGVSLAAVLETLEQKTGTRFRFLNAEARELPIWVRFDALPLSAGIRKLLDDVPYVHYADRKTSTIFVLHSASTKAQFARFERARPVFAAASTDSNATFNPDHTDQGIARSFEQLDSASPGDQVMAINQLMGTRDARAIDALIATATSEGADEVRVQATTALAQDALAGPTKDSKALRVLQQLANEHNPYVRDLARETLQSLERQKAEAARRDGHGVADDAS